MNRIELLTNLALSMIMAVTIMCAHIIEAQPLRMVYADTAGSVGVPSSLVKGCEINIAEELQKSGILLFKTQDISRITRSRLEPTDLHGEKKISYWTRRVKAHKAAVTTLRKERNEYILSVYIIDPIKEKVEFSSEVAFSDPQLFDRAVKRNAILITSYLNALPAQSQLPAKQGYYVRSLVPGLAQSYYGHEQKGQIFQSLFALGVISTGFTYSNYLYKKDQYESYAPSPSHPGDDSYRKKLEYRYEKMVEANYLFLGCGTATLLVCAANLFDAYAISFHPLLPSPEKSIWQSVSIDAGGYFILSPIITAGSITPALTYTVRF